MRLQLLLSLLVVLIAYPNGTTAPGSDILDQVKYKNQIIASIGDDKGVADAAKYLSKKHETVLDYNLECKWNPDLKSFVFQGDYAESVKNVEWDATKIQIVAHGTVGDNLIGGLTPQEMAKEVQKMSGGKGAKKISLVSCTREAEVGVVSNTQPAYLSEFMNEMKNLGVPVSEVSIRSSLVAVNSKGEKLTGEVKMEGTGKRRSYGIEWSSNNRALKWVGNVVDSNGGKKIEIKKSQATTGLDNIETRFVGILPEGRHIYMIDPNDPATSFLIDDENAFRMLDETAKRIYKSGNPSERASGTKYKVSMFDSGKKTFNSGEVELREFTPEDLVKEIRYQAHNFATKNTGGELYRFGNLVVRMDLSNLYVQVAGLVESNIPPNDLKEMQQKWADFPKDYRDMHPKAGADFFDDVKNWINGKNSEIQITPENFEARVFNAQSGTAMFLSESIRCFQNHFTNMMALDMVDAHVLNKELFIGKNIHPMARGGTWPGKMATGVDLLDDMEKSGNKNLKKEYGKIRERLARITKSWLSHVQQTTATGSQDIPQQSQVKQLGSFEDKVKPLIDSIGTAPPGSRSHLRDYEQKFSDKLLSTQFSEPEIGSMETQNIDLSATEDAGASLKASLAIASDHAQVSKAISDAIEDRESSVNKKFEMVSDSIKVIEGKYITFSVFDKENPSHTEEVMATVDESKLSSKAMLEDLQKQAADFNEGSTGEHELTSRVGKGLAIFGVVQGFKGAFSKFEDGDYAEGTIYLAQSLHGLGDLSGINQKIWQASKNFLKEALQGPMEELSASTAVMDAEKVVGSEVSTVIGEVNSGFMDDVPIIGTAFAIYNIVEDFERHSTIGYIDAGLDILTAGLSFLGPEAEPFVIALSIIRMGIDTFYNDISKELNDLPSDATLSQKVTAVFKGIGDAIVDICEEFTLVGQIYSAIENSKKLDEKYEKQQEFLNSLTDFSNYYKVVSGSGSSQINFGVGSLSLYGGGIKFKLGESGTSELTIEVFDSSHQDRSVKKTINTKAVEDITMGIGESYSFTFKKEKVKFLLCIPVDTKWVISGNKSDRHSLHGEYTGNSKDNGFYAIQNVPSKMNLKYDLSEYNYHLYGRDGNDFFYLGPQVTYVEGNEGSDTYYITSNTTTTTIFNYASDKMADYLLLYLNFKDIKAKRNGEDAVFTSSDQSDGHLVKIEYWFVGEMYQHLILKTQDGLVCTISATERDSHLELTPYAFDGKSYKAGMTFDAQEPIMSHVKIITGSSHDDQLYGNDLNNQINGNGGSDTLIGHNGRDLYVLRDNSGTHSVVNNYAEDEKMDILSVCAKNKEDVELVASSQDLLIRSHSCNSEVKIEKWFSDAQHRHLILASADGEVLNISSSRDNLKLQVVMIDLTLQSEHDIQLVMFMFAEDLSSPTTGRYTYEVKNGIDLSRDPHFSQVVTVMGSDHPDWIMGNKQNNYMSAGKGTDFLYGKEGYDVYVIRQGDGLNTIFQKFRGDKHTDTILFDADYDDIKLVKEKLYFGFQAYKSTPEYLAVALSCLLDEEQESEERYHLSASLQTCLYLNELYYVKTRDGIVFKLPTSEDSPMVKTPLLVDYSKTNRGLTTGFTEKLTQVKRFIGSTLDDNILGNSLNNYIDPGIGGCFLEGNNGSDTYVIRSGYGTENGIYNNALDYHLDTLLFLVPFDSISAKVKDKDVVLTSTDASGNVVVSLYNYVEDDANRHLIVVTGDGITFALPPNKNYMPTPLIINKSQMKTGQYVHLTANSTFSEVKTVYGSNGFLNHIVGSKEKNTIVGGSKDDLLEGLNGEDVLKGGAGNDTLRGGPGQDNLSGGPDNDTLIGGDGDDIISPGLGFNLVYGGNGTDTVMYGESGGIEALLPDNVIYHPHDTVVDRVYEVENVFGTNDNDILQGDDEDNVLMGYNGEDELYTGKSGSDILNGGNGSDTYSWLRAVKSFTSAIDSTMIVNNYATDGKIDTVLHDITVKVRSELGFEKSNDDLVIRKINKQYPVFYDNGPIIVFKNWFHSEHQELYRHVQLKLAEEVLDSSTLEAIGDEAAKREQQNKLIAG